MTDGVLGDARGVADEVFFPRAMDVDRMDLVPGELLDALAAAGLYGAAAPREASGLGLDFAGLCAVTEELAGGCLAAAFVWVQHAGLVGRLDDALTDPEPAAMADARAAASELAIRATAALTVHAGSRSVMTDNHAQRLAREAVFLLVFGSRAGIKAMLLRRLSAAPGTLT